MRTHTNNFKVEIAKMGRQVTGKIYHYFNYVVNAETNDKIITENNSYLILEGYNKNDKEELTNENIYSMKLIKNGELLQSLMKQFNFEAKYDLRIGDVINPHFGLLVNDEYEFLDYGDYIIYSKQYNANNDTWDYVCYDLMLYSMIQYNGLNISYPITVKNYINAIANKMGVGFANINEAFTNSDELIYKDLFKDKNKTYRDILDKLAEITASNILINDNNELEVYYPKYAGEMADMSNSSIEITDGEKAELQRFELEGKTEQDGEPTPNNPIELVSVGYENLLGINNKSSTTISGLTYLITGNEITINGTATANGRFILEELIKDIAFESFKNYKIQLVSSGEVSKTFTIQLRDDSSNIYSIEYQYLVLEPKNITNINGNVNHLGFYIASGTIFTDFKIKLQVEKGVQAHSYIPYGKYGIEIKNTGKNLFDFVDFLEKANSTYSNDNNVFTISLLGGAYSSPYTLNLKPNTTYTISQKYYEQTSTNVRLEILKNGSVIGSSHATNQSRLIYTFPTVSDSVYQLRVNYSSGSLPIYFDSVMLEEGTQATTYEEYKSNTYLYTLNNPLRSIGDTKDLLYIKNGYLYVDRKIGTQIVSNGKFWNGDTWKGYYLTLEGKKNTNNNGLMCDRAKDATTGARTENTIYENPGNVMFVGSNTDTLSTLKEKFDGSKVQYVLQTPYTEELGQVDMPSTYEGITYIETTDGNTPTMNITYISEFEEIDEEYLKDVNVNFGEKFGQINKIVLRNTETKIEYVAQDDISIEKNKLTQINIIDNPITLNGNEYNICQNILNKLNGLYYSINDFTTTGLCYYDFLDIFFVKIKDTRYQCLLLNDEITITQGITETIYTEEKTNSQAELGNYETNYLTNKDIQTKITQLNDTKVESKSVINSINDSKERAVISTEKIMYIKDFTGTTDANGFIDIELNSDFVVCSATASFNSNDYGFVIPYYDYNNGSPKWKLKIKNKNDVAVANTQIATTIYYFKKGRND